MAATCSPVIQRKGPLRRAFSCSRQSTTRRLSATSGHRTINYVTGWQPLVHPFYTDYRTVQIDGPSQGAEWHGGSHISRCAHSGEQKKPWLVVQHRSPVCRKTDYLGLK